MRLSLTSCDSYFEVELDDQANLDDVFSQSNTVHSYLRHIYSYIPLEEEIVGSAGAWAVARSDEATYSNYQWVYYNLYRTGNYSSSTPNGLANFGFWDRFYIAINQCTIFLNNIDKDKQDDPKEIEMMKAEARFLRAYYYFCLFRQYGPVFLWFDQTPDEQIDRRRSTATPSIRISSSSSRSCGTSPRSFRRILRRFPPSTPRRGRAAPRRAPRWRCVRACCSTPPRRSTTAPISTRAR